MRLPNLPVFSVSTSMIALAIAMPHSAGADEIVVDSPTDVSVLLDGDDKLTVMQTAAFLLFRVHTV